MGRAVRVPSRVVGVVLRKGTGRQVLRDGRARRQQRDGVEALDDEIHGGARCHGHRSWEEVIECPQLARRDGCGLVGEDGDRRDVAGRHELAANLAAWVSRRVQVHVGVAGSDRGERVSEGVHASGRLEVGCGECARHRAGPHLEGQDDRAGCREVADMDVRRDHGAGQVAVRDRVGDRLRIVRDRDRGRAEPRAGDRGNLARSLQPGCEGLGSVDLAADLTTRMGGRVQVDVRAARRDRGNGAGEGADAARHLEVGRGQGAGHRAGGRGQGQDDRAADADGTGVNVGRHHGPAQGGVRDRVGDR